MKRIAPALLLGILATLFAAVPASAVNTGNEGCTPGYWKNHTENWLETPTQAIPTSTTLEAAGFKPIAYKGSTLLQALSFKGGSTLAGAEGILLRAAAAAWLNAAHEGLGYPLTRFGANSFVTQVNLAIASGDRARMLELAAMLDRTNNLGCPLS